MKLSWKFLLSLIFSLVDFFENLKKKKKKFLSRLIIVPLADYTGREEVENGKMDESCGRVGSTLFIFFVLSELKEKRRRND